MKTALFTLALCLCIGMNAFAQPKDDSTTKSSAPTNPPLDTPVGDKAESGQNGVANETTANGNPAIMVVNDKSAIDVAPPYQPKEPEIAWFDFGISSYSPNNLVIPSNNVGAVSLQTTGIDLYLNDTYQFFGSKVWSGKIGLNWRPLNMTVTNNINGVGVPVTQSSQLISVLLGMEVNPTWASSSNGFVDGYAGLGLLPSFIFTGRGGADGGSTYFGLLFEGSAGVRFHIYKAISLDVGVSEIVGTIQGSSAAGFGVNGGLRIAQ